MPRSQTIYMVSSAKVEYSNASKTWLTLINYFPPDLFQSLDAYLIKELMRVFIKVCFMGNFIRNNLNYALYVWVLCIFKVRVMVRFKDMNIVRVRVGNVC